MGRAGVVLERGLVPLGLCGALGVLGWTWATGADPEAALGGYAAAVLVGVSVLEGVAGRWRPGLRHMPRDGLFWVLGTALNGLGAAAAAGLVGVLGLASPGLLGSLPLPLALLLGLILADGLAYAVHRAFHEVGVLWRLHALHHQPEALYVLMSPVNHPAMVFAVRALPVVGLTLAGFDPRVIFAYAVLDTGIGLLSHAGVRTHNPWLSIVWVTPEVHALHHSARAEDVGNYALMFTLWDRVLGTFVPPRPGGTERVGLSDPSAFPAGWWGMLWGMQPRGAAARPGEAIQAGGGLP